MSSDLFMADLLTWLPCTTSLRALEGLNRGTFMAGIFIFFCVCGFTPLRAFLWPTRKVPRSEIRMVPSFWLSDSWIAFTAAFSTVSATFFVTFASVAIRVTSSAFVMTITPKKNIKKCELLRPQQGSRRLSIMGCNVKTSYDFEAQSVVRNCVRKNGTRSRYVCWKDPMSFAPGLPEMRRIQAKLR